MLARLADLIVDEGKWIATAMLVAFLAAWITCRRAGMLRALNLYFGALIGILAFGHLLAVAVKDARGDLIGDPMTLYAMGILLALPSWSLIRHAVRDKAGRHDETDAWLRMALILNGATALSLLVLGVHNLPLASPAAFNVGYQRARGTIVRRAIATAAVVAQLALFLMAIAFLLSGQSFEQFRE